MGRPPPNWSYRVGRNQRAVTRALLAYGKEFTTAELLRFIYPRLGQLRSWHWKAARAAAELLRSRHPHQGVSGDRQLHRCAVAPVVALQAQGQATQGRGLSTLAPLRALQARTPVRAWARRAVGEGVKSCPRAGCGKSDMSRTSSAIRVGIGLGTSDCAAISRGMGAWMS